MLFADLDANGIAVIVAAFFLGLQQIYAMYLASKRGMEAAKKVEEVKTTLEITNAAHSNVADKVEQVRRETNGMKDALIAEVKKTAFAEGVASVTQKQESPK